MQMVEYMCERMRPQEEIVAVLDRSSNHEFMGEDGLRVSDMRVNDNCPGSPSLHDTQWKDSSGAVHQQKMGKKGLRSVLLERGIIAVENGKESYKVGPDGKACGPKLTGDDLKSLLAEQEDFKNEKPRIEKFFLKRNMRILWGVVCHAELMPSEQKWAMSKNRIRQQVDNKAGKRFEKMVFDVMNSIPAISIQRFFRKTRDTMKIYRDGCELVNLPHLVKKHASHRVGVWDGEVEDRAAPEELP